MNVNTGYTLSLAAALVLASTPAAAQTLAQRVQRAPDGEVRLSYASRPGVCGDGEGMIGMRRPGDDGLSTTWVGRMDTRNGRNGWEDRCEPGPVRLVLTVENGRVTALQPYVGGSWGVADDRVTDLGMVTATDAASYLLSLAERGDSRVAKRAIFPATLADDVVIWRDLLRIARNPDAPQKSREQAVFWVGQEAAEAATRGLDDLVNESSVDREVREHAVFALSQRPHDEGVPALIGIARTHPDPEIRKKALFWLGQSGDPRAIALFEEILTEP